MYIFDISTLCKKKNILLIIDLNVIQKKFLIFPKHKVLSIIASVLNFLQSPACISNYCINTEQRFKIESRMFRRPESVSVISFRRRTRTTERPSWCAIAQKGRPISKALISAEPES